MTTSLSTFSVKHELHSPSFGPVFSPSVLYGNSNGVHKTSKDVEVVGEGPLFQVSEFENS